MTTWVGDEEYKRIKDSWRQAPHGQKARHFDYGTARENLDRCHANLRALARQEQEMRELDERLPPGDNRRLAQRSPDGKREILPSLQDRIRNNRLEQKHWREYVTHYQKLAAAEPQPRRPTDPIPADAAPRRAREPGEDDVPLEAMVPPPADPRLPREEDPDDVGTGS